MYEVNDNRITIQGFFFEQDDQGNIHIYDNREKKLIYFDKIDNAGILSYDMFISKCKLYLSTK